MQRNVESPLPGFLYKIPQRILFKIYVTCSLHAFNWACVLLRHSVIAFFLQRLQSVAECKGWYSPA